VITQELNFIRQGDLPLLQYYDNIQKKLTLLTNKVIMTQDAYSAHVLNSKYREDALHTFVSGLKKSLKIVVFPAHLRDLPTALAIAQEAEVSNERSIFAANFARHTEEKTQKNTNQRNQNWRSSTQYNQNDNQIQGA